MGKDFVEQAESDENREDNEQESGNEREKESEHSDMQGDPRLGRREVAASALGAHLRASGIRMPTGAKLDVVTAPAGIAVGWRPWRDMPALVAEFHWIETIG